MFRANIFRFELRRHLRSALWWALGVVALHLVYLPFFKPFAENAAMLEESLKRFPKAFLEAFGMGRISMATALGFYTLIFLLVQIVLAIQAARYGVALVSREESERTADFLMTRPVSRWAIINSKLAAALVALLATQAVLWASAFAGWAAFSAGYEYDKGRLALLLSSALPFQLFFLAVGLAISQAVRLVRNATPYALGLGLGAYALGAFSDIGGEVKLEWLTPFKYFEAASLVLNGYEMRYLVLDLAIVAVALVFGYWRFLNRDIPTVT